jgi:hypothetical protein
MEKYNKKKRRDRETLLLQTGVDIRFDQSARSYFRAWQQRLRNVSIRQHTSAYAGIRQHTSAYASIPCSSACATCLRHASTSGSTSSLARAPGSASIRQHTSAYTSAYVSIRQHTSAYIRHALAHLARAPGSASICQHTSAYTSAYVSIRQHTSADVSIRQHTSAYIRQHLLSESAPSACWY